MGDAVKRLEQRPVGAPAPHQGWRSQIVCLTVYGLMITNFASSGVVLISAGKS